VLLHRIGFVDDDPAALIFSARFTHGFQKMMMIMMMMTATV